MFHGSNHFIKDKIVPNTGFHCEPYVYGTNDFNYALVRAGKFDINNFFN